MERKDRNQGEGDRASARRYDHHVESFVAEGKVDPAARDAKQYVEKDPEGAARAERATKRGRVTVRAIVEEMYEQGRALFKQWRAKLTTAARPKR